MKYKRLVIGIDQSYARTGVSIAADGKLLKVTSFNYKGCNNNTEKRLALAQLLTNILSKNAQKASHVVIICERIRTRSKGVVSTDYIKATGALIATIVDTAFAYNVKVYSVATNSWKAQIVGSNKAVDGDPKLLTMQHVKRLGFDVSTGKTNKKGVPTYNDDASDSACIALYGFLPASQRKLELEK